MKCVKLLCSMAGHKAGEIVRVSDQVAQQWVTNDYASYVSKSEWKKGKGK